MNDSTPHKLDGHAGDHGHDAYMPKVDRRTTLAWIGVVGAATVGAGVVTFGPRMGGKPARGFGMGYGTDPNLVKPEPAPWPRILTKDELQAAARVADFILPATATAPAATTLGVPDFIDEWVSAPYPGQLRDRPIIVGGLRALIPDVVQGDAATRAKVLAALPHAKGDAAKAFFRRFRSLTIGAYYTTEAGFKDIGYIGNVARVRDPGPSPEVIAVLEERLKGLGL
jgi:hypothetical protein